MPSVRYHFDLLHKHSNETALATRRELKKQILDVRRAFDFLDHHFRSLEQKPKSHARNVKLALTARFINHLFSALVLIERGLILDAVNCTRSALETTAFYWLVCINAESASLYDAEKSLPPVEIRKRLEGLGIDIAALRELYALESTIAHVGNQYDQLQIRWESDNDGKLLIGGGQNLPLQKAMLEGLIAALFRFVKYDDDYIVDDADKPAASKATEP